MIKTVSALWAHFRPRQQASLLSSIAQTAAGSLDGDTVKTQCASKHTLTFSGTPVQVHVNANIKSVNSVHLGM